MSIKNLKVKELKHLIKLHNKQAKPGQKIKGYGKMKKKELVKVVSRNGLDVFFEDYFNPKLCDNLWKSKIVGKLQYDPVKKQCDTELEIVDENGNQIAVYSYDELPAKIKRQIERTYKDDKEQRAIVPIEGPEKIQKILEEEFAWLEERKEVKEDPFDVMGIEVEEKKKKPTFGEEAKKKLEEQKDVPAHLRRKRQTQWNVCQKTWGKEASKYYDKVNKICRQTLEHIETIDPEIKDAIADKIDDLMEDFKDDTVKALDQLADEDDETIINFVVDDITDGYRDMQVRIRDELIQEFAEDADDEEAIEDLLDDVLDQLDPVVEDILNEIEQVELTDDVERDDLLEEIEDRMPTNPDRPELETVHLKLDDVIKLFEETIMDIREIQEGIKLGQDLDLDDFDEIIEMAIEGLEKMLS